MKNKPYSLAEIKAIDLVNYLGKLGHRPVKIHGTDHWYLSPLRQETKASFKVNQRLNAWYDHGLGRGGNLLDFGMLYYNCNLKELAEKISGHDFLIHEHALKPANNSELTSDNTIRVMESKPLEHPSLLYYLQQRMIPVDMARQYCREIHYDLKEKSYYAIGFKNNSGGYELRNAFFKGSSSPKASTLVKTEGATSLKVLEGFFSFLSWQTAFGKEQPAADFLVLNSLSLLDRNLELIRNYPSTSLLLDNDPAGDKATEKLLSLSASITDGRSIYAGYKDLNHWLTEGSPQLKKIQFPEIKPAHEATRLHRGRGI